MTSMDDQNLSKGELGPPDQSAQRSAISSGVSAVVCKYFKGLASELAHLNRGRAESNVGVNIVQVEMLGIPKKLQEICRVVVCKDDRAEYFRDSPQQR